MATGRGKKEMKRKKSPVLNNSKKASSWAEADMKCEHHRGVSASVSPSHAPPPARRTGTGFCAHESNRHQMGVDWAQRN